MDRLIDDTELARLTGRCRSTIQKDRLAGRGLPFIKLGRLVRYRESDVTRYLAELATYTSTSEVSSRPVCSVEPGHCSAASEQQPEA